MKLHHFLLFFACSVILTIYAPMLVRMMANLLPDDLYSVPLSIKDPSVQRNTITAEELATYTGEKGSPGMYLSILGKVYDVKGGEKHYGPDSSYNFFVGKDGSKAFITGNFQSTEDDNVLSLLPREIQSLVQWEKFYEDRYRFVGYLIGQFYDQNGLETEYLKNVHEQVKIAEQMQRTSDKLKIEYPPCNVEWTADAATRVWCTKESGGVSREWVGVPRKYFQPGVSDWRCACIEHVSDNSVKEFEGCDPKSTSCEYNADV